MKKLCSVEKLTAHKFGSDLQQDHYVCIDKDDNDLHAEEEDGGHFIKMSFMEIMMMMVTFLDSLCNSATGGQSKGLNFLKLSDDRDVWRGMVANVCSRSGT